MDIPFKIALTFSLIAHTIVFLKFPHMNLVSSRHSLDQLAVSYIKKKAMLSSLESYPEKFPQKPSGQTFSKMLAPPPSIKKESIFKKTKEIAVQNVDTVKPKVTTLGKRITLPPLNEAEITNPIYLNYYQIVREKIRQEAYQNYSRLVNGEVHLSFVILRNGELKEIEINEKSSTKHQYLKRIAQESIQLASPFPDFPEDLNYPNLSFNVIISFETE